MLEYQKIKRRLLGYGCSVLVAVMLLGAGILASAPAYADEASDSNTLTDITFMLDFKALGRHAPWYVALAKGYYKDAGLNVKIVPGQGTAQALQALEAGLAEFAFTDVTALVLGHARGVSNARMLMVNYQKAPYAIFSLHDGANVTKASQLEGLTIASSASSNTPDIIKGLMADKGLDPSSVTFTNVAGSARPALLLTGQVPAIETYVFGKVGMLRHTTPEKLTTFLLADHGLTLYSNGVVVRNDYMQQHPDVVRAFVHASLKGWKYALSHMQQAAKMEKKYVPSLNEQTAVGELKLVKEMAITAPVKAHGLGYIDPDMMQRSVDFIVKHIGISGDAPAIDDLYTNKFQPKPPVMP